MSLVRQILVMQAVLEGKPVQRFSLFEAGQMWKDGLGDTAWDWRRYDYRIAPEPRKAREVYVHYSADDPHQAMLTVNDGQNPCPHCVLMREVLPESDSLRSPADRKEPRS